MTPFDDVQHYATIIAGCENINKRLEGGSKLSQDGRYAQTVLTLHAGDAGFVAGTEGFMDSIKRGATNIYEWIKKMISAIRDWFRGNKVDKEAERLDQLSKQFDLGISGAEIKRMGARKFVQFLVASKQPQRAGNERISIDTVAEEVEKMSPEQLKQVELYLASITDDPEFKEAVKEEHDFVVNKAMAAIKPRLTELNGLLEQMKEADPDGEAGKALGIEPDRAFSQFSDLLTKIDHISASTLTSTTNRIGRGVVDANKLLKSATDKLDSLNNTNKVGGGPVVSKAARIVSLLTTFVEVGRKLVAQLVVIMEKGEYNALSVFISRRWFEARTQFAAIK
ncbi:hypothetical protein pETSU_037 [Edwardsiella phage pEt-SU]|uniref:Uncharacterized protein n=1 Tax=Edwardsiella phage pEt-SU TaxID=2562142 RepID=A0A4D6DWL3_9CAUD|nr:hypothetical protein HOV39_gp037 [Edwardsiella phage pEt-SU]QBZ70618.1 hypothetical protein pETSU_037 [Edwardsiella phage pEt-SU]